MTITVTPGAPESISPDTVAFHPFDALRKTMTNYTTTLVASENLSDRAQIKVPVAPELETIDFVDEGAEIPETKTQLEEVTIPTRKLAVIKTVSREAIGSRNGDALSSMLSAQLFESLYSTADNALFGASTTKGGLTGLSALKGVETAEVTNNLDPFVDAVANVLALRGKEEETVIVAHPGMWAHVAKIKDSKTGARPLVDTMTASQPFTVPNSAGTIAVDGLSRTVAGDGEIIHVRTLMGIPMFLSPYLDKGTMLVFDRSNVAVGASPVEITYSEHAAFKRDALAIRGTYRLGWKVYNPARITKLIAPSAANVAA